MTLITTEPDMSIEPGHQVIVMPANTEGIALAKLLTSQDNLLEYLVGVDGGEVLEIGYEDMLHIPHNHVVDQNIVALIDALAHVRFSAPGLVQMTLAEVAEADALHEIAMDAMHEMDAWQAVAKQES